MNSGAGADSLGKRNICCLSWESNPGSSADQSVDWLLYLLSYPGLYPHESGGEKMLVAITLLKVHTECRKSHDDEQYSLGNP
jgi:hypothetical protein